MNERLPRAWGGPLGHGRLRSSPGDFLVEEQLGFEPEGSGEHLFLFIEKSGLNTADVVERVARLAGVPRRDVGYSGLKDRSAITRQWLSVCLTGRPEPDWSLLEEGGSIRLLHSARHLRKLRRGVHRGNRFTLVIRELQADPAVLEPRLALLAREGVPNYFGPQRFGHGGSTLTQARDWLARGTPRVSRNRRSLYLSALRAALFNHLLASRVEDHSWNTVLPGDACILHGTRSVFCAEQADADIVTRCQQGDLHPGLPLWGRGRALSSEAQLTRQRLQLGEDALIADALIAQGLELAYRPARALADDFSWQFCDDDALQLEFSLGAGSYATTLVAELIDFSERDRGSGGSGD